MAGLIFWIIIIVIIVKNVQKRQTGEQNGYGTKQISQTKKDAAGHKGLMEYERNIKKAAQKVVHPRTGAERTRTASGGQTAKAEEISTTEYLRQKALEDEKEHAEEARREAMRLSRETGGRPAAQRYLDGDSIPRGMRLVKCGYCGAENLIAEHHNQKDYTCCFCREIL